MDKSKLSKVGKLVIEIFEERYPDDSGYIKGKIERLSGLDDFQTLFWCSSELDGTNKNRLADKIGVEIDILQITFLTVRNIKFL